MKRAVPVQYIWWLVSRASGIVAVVLISLSVLLGLAMATKLLPRPGLKRAVVRLHEHLALVALVAIAVHGIALLGDHWLKPGWRGIAVPFALRYRPQYTGLGIIAGYLAVLVGPSFYVRKRIGARRWRKLHRATVVVWILAVVHTIGAGSDGMKPWLQAVVIAPGVPIVYLVVMRVLAGDSRAAGAKRERSATLAPQPPSNPGPAIGPGRGRSSRRMLRRASAGPRGSPERDRTPAASAPSRANGGDR